MKFCLLKGMERGNRKNMVIKILDNEVVVVLYLRSERKR